MPNSHITKTVLITGATGMVGEGVLIECLRDDRVSTILSVSRRPSGKARPKLKELFLDDFMNIGDYKDQLTGLDACFFCAGISAIGMSEEKYQHITYDIAIRFAEVLLQANSQMTFIFVSGAHTDTTEKGRLMWARVKGKTENALGKMPFKDHYNFRPGLMQPDKEQVHLTGYNRYARLMYPVVSLFMKGCTIQEIARAMIAAVVKGYPKKTLEVADIRLLAKDQH